MLSKDLFSKKRLIKVGVITLMALFLVSAFFSWFQPLRSKAPSQTTERLVFPNLIGQSKVFECEEQNVKPVISTSYKQHNPIVIKNNSDFLTQAFTGTGTFDDPFLIEELNITSSAGYLIEIRNTTAWFIIRNNLLNGLDTSFGGIYLYGVSHAIISGNIIYNNDEYGIYAAYSSNVIMIVNNTLFDNSAGIAATRSAYDINIINNTVFNNLKWSAILASYETHDILIANNTLFNSGWYGIFLWGSAYNNTVIDNIAYNNSMGIWVANDCSKNTIHNNTFYHNNIDGIRVSYSDRNIISSNTVFNNLEDGVTVHGSSDNSITSNLIHNNSQSGISVIFDYGNYLASTNNSIESNSVFDNGDNGIDLEKDAKYNALTSNSIYRNKEAGILLLDESDHNLITKNTIHKNSFGIKILNSSSNHIISNEISNHTDYGITVNSLNMLSSNIIEQNNFLGNNYNRGTQAHDDGSNNIFIHNFWDDWKKSDSNNDNFIDEPYAIDGSANTMDLYPSVTLIDIAHWITIPRIIKPTLGETINNSYIIQWTPASDPLDHEIDYTIFFSSDNGETWILLVSGLSETTYTWNTRVHNDSTSYRLMIKAICSAGKSVTIISRAAFTIQNTPNGGGGNNLLIQIFTILAAGILISCLGYFWLRFRSEKPQSFYEFIQSSQLDFLKTIHKKVVTALDNISLAAIKTGVIPEAIDIPTIDVAEETTLIQYFPSDFRDDLKYEMKGRTVLTLIEIACQYPHETNPTKLSRILKIPPSTLSEDIKRLIKLQYIEHHVEISRDARYRVYSVTLKGYRFLYTMKSALEISIIRLKERHVGS